MSYKLYTDKTETFKCKIHLEGAELTEATTRLIVQSSKFNLLFEGTIDKNGNCEVPVIADDTYFEPWTSDFSVDTSKKIKVEVQEYKSENNKPKIKITGVKTPFDPITEISKVFNKKGITQNKFVTNKKKFVPVLKEYSKKINYKKDVKSFIIEVVKKLKN